MQKVAGEDVPAHLSASSKSIPSFMIFRKNIALWIGADIKGAEASLRKPRQLVAHVKSKCDRAALLSASWEGQGNHLTQL